MAHFVTGVAAKFIYKPITWIYGLELRTRWSGVRVSLGAPKLDSRIKRLLRPTRLLVFSIKRVGDFYANFPHTHCITSGSLPAHGDSMPPAPAGHGVRRSGSPQARAVCLSTSAPSPCRASSRPKIRGQPTHAAPCRGIAPPRTTKPRIWGLLEIDIGSRTDGRPVRA